MAKDRSTSTEPLANGAVESARLTVDGRQVHYLKSGSGHPVVLLHGGDSDCRDWLGTMDTLSDSHTFFAPDLIGYGQSDKSKDGYCLSDFVDFTMRFTEVLGLKSSSLVGHSLGGRVCLEIALRYPEKVRRLVLINAAAFSKLALWGAFLGALFWGARKLLRLPQPYPRFLKENGGYGNWTCLDQLSALRVPTLIVWSRHDPYYSLAGAVRVVKLIPQACLEVLPCLGHAPHLQRRESFNGMLLDFLNRD